MEEVLKWMTKMEQAADQRRHSNYEQLLSQFTFNEEMAKWVAQSQVGVTRWYAIWGKMKQIEKRREQAWREIYWREQRRALLERHLIRS
jgi:hypothetical protein